MLEVYKRPDNPKRPAVGINDQPKQPISEIRRPVPAAHGLPKRADYEYVREGVCVVLMFVGPLAGWRDVRVMDTKTAVDRAHQARQLVDVPRYAGAERVTPVCDDLNTRTMGSLYQAFSPAEALRIAKKLELVHTPKRGSWLNVVEPESRVLKGGRSRTGSHTTRVRTPNLGRHRLGQTLPR